MPYTPYSTLSSMPYENYTTSSNKNNSPPAPKSHTQSHNEGGRDRRNSKALPNRTVFRDTQEAKDLGGLMSTIQVKGKDVKRESPWKSLPKINITPQSPSGPRKPRISSTSWKPDTDPDLAGRYVQKSQSSRKLGVRSRVYSLDETEGLNPTELFDIEYLIPPVQTSMFAGQFISRPRYVPGSNPTTPSSPADYDNENTLYSSAFGIRYLFATAPTLRYSEAIQHIVAPSFEHQEAYIDWYCRAGFGQKPPSPRQKTLRRTPRYTRDGNYLYLYENFDELDSYKDGLDDSDLSEDDLDDFGLSEENLDEFDLSNETIDEFDSSEDGIDDFGLSEESLGEFDLSNETIDEFDSSEDRLDDFDLSEEGRNEFGSSEENLDEFDLSNETTDEFDSSKERRSRVLAKCSFRRRYERTNQFPESLTWLGRKGRENMGMKRNFMRAIFEAEELEAEAHRNFGLRSELLVEPDWSMDAEANLRESQRRLQALQASPYTEIHPDADQDCLTIQYVGRVIASPYGFLQLLEHIESSAHAEVYKIHYLCSGNESFARIYTLRGIHPNQRKRRVENLKKLSRLNKSITAFDWEGKKVWVFSHQYMSLWEENSTQPAGIGAIGRTNTKEYDVKFPPLPNSTPIQISTKVPKRAVEPLTTEQELQIKTLEIIKDEIEEANPKRWKSVSKKPLPLAQRLMIRLMGMNGESVDKSESGWKARDYGARLKGERTGKEDENAKDLDVKTKKKRGRKKKSGKRVEA